MAWSVFFSRDLPAHERPGEGHLADATAGVGLEAVDELAQRQADVAAVLGVEVALDLHVVGVGEEPCRASAVGFRLDRAGVSVAAEQILDGGEADGEAVSDLALGGAAGEHGGEDASAEVE